MKKTLALLLSLLLILSFTACTNDNDSAKVESNEDKKIESSAKEKGEDEQDIPNNGEWDKILCSADGYYLVEKKIDTYDEFSILIGVVDKNGEWVQELTDTGSFVENINFRASGGNNVFENSSSYIYLGEGVFLASPGVSVYDETSTERVGNETNMHSKTQLGNTHVTIWECILWNVKDNIQMKISASKITKFHDGYALFCEEDEFGGGRLSTIDTQGNVTDLDCEYLPMKPVHDFPVYSEGLFFANALNGGPGFFDIQGNLVIDLSQYDMRRLLYTSVMDINAPYFKDGEATILFKNDGGSEFKGTIDKTGTFVKEPEKISLAEI